MASVLGPEEVLERIPQREPFRFVDTLHAVDGEKVEASYRWRPEADFYRGHFPGHPVTPGVLLVECMAQAGVVPMAIYLVHATLEPEEAEGLLPFFTDASVEFSGAVPPGARVHVRSERVFFRRRKLRCRSVMELEEEGKVVCSGELAGVVARP